MGKKTKISRTANHVAQWNSAHLFLILFPLAQVPSQVDAGLSVLVQIQAKPVLLDDLEEIVGCPGRREGDHGL